MLNTKCGNPAASRHPFSLAPNPLISNLFQPASGVIGILIRPRFSHIDGARQLALLRHCIFSLMPLKKSSNWLTIRPQAA